MSDEAVGRIRVLPSELADQIAAGEVVERPASVVKELVENALDAGARRVEVEIERGGLERIVVTDDGAGMTPAEAHLALKRHATSKLRALDDLLTLGSMGFRGEALPSIAAVSELWLTTRSGEAPNDVGAYELVAAAGLVQKGRQVGAPVGTRIEVKELFGNVPARLKFVKGVATESAHVTETVLRLALAFPAVHFRLRADGRQVHDLPPHSSGHERAKVALGRGRQPARLHLGRGQEHGIAVEAYLGSPGEAANSGRTTYLFVNRRFVRDRGLLHAVLLGYGELLARGRYPLAVVHLTLPGDVVDINVHPQKLEVRFARPQDVYAAVRHTVAAAAATAPWLADGPGSAVAAGARLGLADEDAGGPPLGGAATGTRSGLADGEGGAPALGALGGAGRAAFGGPLAGGRTGGGYASPPLDRLAVRQPELGYAERRRRAEEAMRLFAPPTEPLFGSPAPARDDEEPGRFFSSLVYLGQLHRTYLLCQAPGELVLVDQHAAHERVAFQRLREARAQKIIKSQRLLLPATVNLTPPLVAAVDEHEELLASLGFALAPIGDDAVAVQALPDLLAQADPVELLTEVLGELAERASTELVTERLDHVLATMACHSVVRAGDLLGEREVRALFESMDGVDYRAHCPHGRPVLLRLSLTEIERRFGRT